MITVLLAEDHHLVRGGLQSLLQESDDINVVSDVENGKQALEQIRALEPDVAVLDYAMPIMNGDQVTRHVRAQDLITEILILSLHRDEMLVREAFRAGAKGYVLKSALLDELVTGIRKVAKGEFYISPSATHSLLTPELLNDGTYVPPFERLSARERQVLKQIAEGRTSLEIAKSLKISISTVEKHRVALMDKLRIHSIAGLVVFAMKNGVSPPP